MSAIKERLIEYIEAYAIAKASSNSILLSLSAGALRQLVDSLDIKEIAQKPTPPSQSSFDDSDFTIPEAPTRPTRSSKRAS
jgi:hypothetical protein